MITKCHKCDHPVKSMNAFMKHLEFQQCRNYKYKYKCSICKKGFVRRKHWENHKKKCKLKCQYCDREFAYPQSLRLHERKFCKNRPTETTINSHNNISLNVNINSQNVPRPNPEEEKQEEQKELDKVKQELETLKKLHNKMLRRRQREQYGVKNLIYILSHHTFPEDQFKIGITGNLTKRLSTYNTGVVKPYVVEATYSCPNLKLGDPLLKTYLEPYLVESNGEIYDIDIDKAETIIEKVIENANQQF